MKESVEMRIIKAKMEVLGWMYAFACNALDRGEDIRKIEVPELLERMHQDLDKNPARQ